MLGEQDATDPVRIVKWVKEALTCGQALPKVFEKYNLLRFCVSEETSVCRLPRTSVCRLRRKLNPSYPTSCRQGRGSLLVSAVAPLRKAGACWSWPLMRQLAFTVPSFALLLAVHMAFSPRPDFPSAERITTTFQKRQMPFALWNAG